MKYMRYAYLILLVFVCCWQYLPADFKPDFHIKSQTSSDKNLRNRLKPLFAEITKSDGPKSLQEKYMYVQKRCVDYYGVWKILLKTQQPRRIFNGKVSISVLIREVKGALFNVILVPGWFHGWTPPKEWCAPYFEIFSNENVFTFDWPGVHESSGSNPFLFKNSFGTNSWVCLQELINFVRKRSNKPIILYGFCFGAAMVLHTTCMAQHYGLPQADALGLSCVFARASEIFKHNMKYIENSFYAMLRDIGLDKFVVSTMNNGSFFDLNPVEMIQKIKQPCFFDFYTHDKTSPYKQGVEVYKNAKKDARYLCLSDVGKHVRIAPSVPSQWKACMYNFFYSKVMPSLTTSKL